MPLFLKCALLSIFFIYTRSSYKFSTSNSHLRSFCRCKILATEQLFQKHFFSAQTFQQPNRISKHFGVGTKHYFKTIFLRIKVSMLTTFYCQLHDSPLFFWHWHISKFNVWVSAVEKVQHISKVGDGTMNISFCI